MTIAGYAAEHHPVVFIVPFIDGQHEEFFPDAPGIGQRGDKRRVDHVPGFPVVLHFLSDYTVNMCHALSYSITTKLCKDIRHRYFIPVAGDFDVAYNFIDHELVIVFETERVFDGEATTDINRIQFRTNFFQLTIKVDHFIEFTPVIDIIFDSFVEEDVQHFQLEAVFVAFNLIYIKFQNVFCTYA